MLGDKNARAHLAAEPSVRRQQSELGILWCWHIWREPVIGEAPRWVAFYRRGNRLWIRFKGPDGRWTQQKTSHSVGSETKVRKLLLETEARIAAGTAFAAGNPDLTAGGEPLTVGRYAKKWIEERKGLDLADCAGDAARLENHVLPVLGAYSGATWAPVPAALGHGFRNDAGAHSGSIWALIPA